MRLKTFRPVLPVDMIPQIQVTLDCNLGCSYCFQKHDKGIMDLAVVKKILEKITAASHTPETTIIWHGGEPLLAGIEFFRQVVRMQSDFPGIRFTNQVQTNATLMTKPFAEFFRDHHFQVGFSLDGPAHIHNRHRVYKGSGSCSFSQTMKGIETFRQVSGQKHLPVIAVITRDSVGWARELFCFFKQLQAKVQLDFYDIRCLDMTENAAGKPDLFKMAPDGDAVGSFLISLFDLWFYDTTGRVDFPELRNEVKMILQPETDKGNPFHKKRCNMGRIIFAPDGKVFSCDQYVNDDQTSLGDITQDSLRTILDKKARLWEDIKHHVRGSGKQMACFSCEWGRQHPGGCVSCMKYNYMLLLARQKGLPDHRWSDAVLPPFLENIQGETFYCKGLKAFRTHAQQRIAMEMADA